MKLLIVAILVLVGIVVSFYALVRLAGTPNLPPITGAISAVSAAASAVAALLVWRISVQAGKLVLIDRVLGPTYSEIRKSREFLNSWKTEAYDHALNMPFLKQVDSEWRYYRLNLGLRTELERLRDLVPTLEEQRALSKTSASAIIRQCAEKLFDIHPLTAVRLWTSHSWVEGQTGTGSGRSPDWELVVDSDPLKAAPGLYVYCIEVVNFDTQKSEYLPLLNQQKAPVNADRFQEFWESARKLAGTNETIILFRKLLNQTIDALAALEHKIDFQIKYVR